MTDGMIASRYRLERRLGVGGMSTVQLAFDERLERAVAIKLLAEHLADDPSFVSRFRREALAAARLVHPNIVQVFDFGFDEPSGRHFIVMEFVPGRSCAEILRDDGPMTPDQVVDVAVQANRGLDHAHRHGVVHRDVKPGNLMVSPDGIVKLADFGIAKAAEQSSITQVGSVLGTAAYLAPEQARGEEATPASDVYALGVVIYQLLTGRLPWEGATLAELAIRRESERPLPPSSYDSEVPETLSTAVLRSLEGDPALRYSTARELSVALAAGGSGHEPPAPNGVGTTATRALATEPTGATRRLPAEPTPPTRRPRPRQAPRSRPPSRAPAPKAKRSVGRRFTRALGVLLVIAILAGVVAGVVLLTTNAGKNTDLIKHTIPEQIDQLKQFIHDHTQ
jgi:eukaryotic-like serine/threonine-protein kinase